MKRISQPLAQGLLAGLFVLGGCQGTQDRPYATFFTPSAPYEPRQGSGNAYDGYLLAGNRVIQDCPEDADRINYTEGSKQALRKCAAPALRDLLSAATREASIDFRPRDPFLPRPGFQGLVVLTRALKFEAEAAVANKNWERCAELLQLTTKIAADFTNGDASDSSMGIAMANSVRGIVAPYIAEFPAGTLSSLSQSLNQTLNRAPDLQTSVNNEGQNFLAGVQFVQDCQQKKDYKTLETALYKAAQPGIDYLKRLSPSERENYFEGFAKEAAVVTRHYAGECEKPTADRTSLEFDERTDRPWKRLSSQLFGTIQPLLTLHDDFIAKSRLMAVTAYALARSKSTQQAPRSFEGLGATITIDPFSGKPMPYRVAGREFKVYCVGPDGRDDGGSAENDVLLENMALD